MVQNALIHLHKKKAIGEQVKKREEEDDRAELLSMPRGESQQRPAARENLISGNIEKGALTGAVKISNKGPAPLLLPHPGRVCHAPYYYPSLVDRRKPPPWQSCPCP
jgi:hypothetical protein